MKHLLTISMLTIAIFATTRAQQVTYNDVLVLVNSNSQLSQDVASYFRAQRGIPNQNICAIAMPTTEEITGAEFDSIATLMSNYLTATNLTASINYIVTTQGVPLKVRRLGSVFSNVSDASSFDSDLCLVQSDRASYIGGTGPSSNPYYNSTTSFARTAGRLRVRLVTRLAGYSYNDITGLIDRAALPYTSTGTFVIDADPSKAITYQTLHSHMQTAPSTLRARGYNVLFDTTSTYVTRQSTVLGYAGYGSNDAYWQTSGAWKAQPRFTWSAKALAQWYVSSSARSFSDSTFIEPTIGWQSLIADLIHEQGVTGVKGYVWEPYSNAMANVGILFDLWSNGLNLAESFYAASRYMSWMDVVVGDPKTTLAGHGHLPVELVAFGGQFVNNTVRLNWKTATESNNYGFEVQKRSPDGSWFALGFVSGAGTSNSPKSYTFTDEKPDALNTYRLRQIDRDGTDSHSSIVQVRGRATSSFELAQNYPNPFNPSTAIAFTAPQASDVSLQIYAIDGRLVRTLLVRDTREAGSHALIWDGTDDAGRPAASGLYVYRLTAETGGSVLFTATKSMSLVR